MPHFGQNPRPGEYDPYVVKFPIFCYIWWKPLVIKLKINWPVVIQIYPVTYTYLYTLYISCLLKVFNLAQYLANTFDECGEHFPKRSQLKNRIKKQWFEPISSSLLSNFTQIYVSHANIHTLRCLLIFPVPSSCYHKESWPGAKRSKLLKWNISQHKKPYQN